MTIRHLLESRSGIDQVGGVWGAVDASKAAGGTLPSDGTEVARWVSGLKLKSTPGTTTVYGNTDYFLLSLVVMKKTGAASFEAALDSLVLDPLHMTHTHGSRSAATGQVAGDARHHMTVHNPVGGWPLYQLELQPSVRAEGRPLVASHHGSYDYEMFDGCGGLSSSVVDVARLCAMFADRTGNPVFKAERIDDMLAHAVAATTAGTDHGYHGMDGAVLIDAAKHAVRFNKGGWLPGRAPR